MDIGLINCLKYEAETCILPYGAHGFEHTLRVFLLCNIIGKKVGADLDILLPAALLHDIVRNEGEHAEASAKKARQILEKYNLNNTRVDSICSAINTHSYTGKREPQSLEAKILSDADKLDALGALGIYRAGVYSGEHPRSIDDFVAHFYDKLLRLSSYLYTREARKIALERTAFMKKYLAQLEKELLRI